MALFKYRCDQSVFANFDMLKARAQDSLRGQVPIPSGWGILHHFRTKRGIFK